ncbi:hypothetical protein AOB60_10715 [Streptomyces noursei]|uniref:Uncharacterized protein n=1 Tax=Streptomyces noursei TaxID=1971 RepID=A0A2N8PJH6_STRNR|nr:hypothetical protein AOB60_10715 [Streptomyces noursei]
MPPGRTADLITEERTTLGPGALLRAARSAVPRGAAVAFLTRALAEQLSKQLHGRFPLYDTDPPVGQDEPSMHTPADPDIL